MRRKKGEKNRAFYKRHSRLFLTAGLGLVLIASGYFLYPAHIPVMKEGVPSTEDIYADRDLSVPVGIDEEKTYEKREDEAAKIKDVYDMDSQVKGQTLSDLNAFFDKLEELKGTPGISDGDRLTILKGELKSDISDWNLKAFVEAQDVPALRPAAVGVTEEILTRGIVSDSAMNALLERGIESIRIRESPALKEVEKKVEDILSIEEALQGVEKNVSARIETNRKLKSALNALIRMYIEPNLYFNREDTSRRRQDAEAQALPVFKYLDIKKDMKVIDKGYPVTGEQILILKELTRLRGQRDVLWSILGLGLVTVVSIVLFGTYLKLYEPLVYDNIRILYL
ncbi:MAG: hypothetical protein HYV00_02435, partial [Deltaproteobacteria bacterium]|nr:hypothetical protein [Deltaproteobacteria bacterium]